MTGGEDPPGSPEVVVTYSGPWRWPAYTVHRMLTDHPAVSVLGSPVPSGDAVAVAADRQPDAMVVVLPAPMGPTRPEALNDFLAELRRVSPRTGVVVMSGHTTGIPLGEISDGDGRAFLSALDLQDEQPIVTAIRAVSEGMAYISPGYLDSAVRRADREQDPLARLTGQQQDVLRLMADGLSNAAIAERKHLSLKAVENYIGAIFRALRLKNDERVNRRVQAARLYLERHSL